VTLRGLTSGLRGRLLLALVLTAAVTLGATAAVVLGPLRQRLRAQSVHNLRAAVDEAQPDFQLALRDDSGIVTDAANRAQTTKQFGAILSQYPLASRGPATTLNARTDARVAVTGVGLPLTFGAVFDTDNSPPTQSMTLASEEVYNQGQTTTLFDGDTVTMAAPLFGERGQVTGTMVVSRRLSEVATAVEQVRDALLVAALVGLAVAIALGITLSRTLTLRLGRLRTAALRVSAEGPAAPAPRDSGRDEVGDLARALARMQEELRRQETARRSFVATASHELRTPLTMLQGTMELLEEDLRDGGDLEDAQQQVASARVELLRLSALAGELLDLSRLDAAVQLRSEQVELGEVARAVAAEFDVRARDRGVEIEVVPPPVACWGRGDPDAVARVVRILLDNSLRYAPPGAPIRVRALSDGDGAGIEVRDHGPGIPEEERERIFERFHRGRAASTASGFGLGLAIGRELAERMNGELRLAEARGPGACFVLTLPAGAPAPGGAPEPVSAAS
jgi:signal transduction histidine kinase